MHVMCTTIIGQSITDNISQIGGQWTGTLTYTDYSDDISQSTLECVMKIEWTGNKATLSFGFTEPNGKIVYDKNKLKVYANEKAVKYDGDKYFVDSFNVDSNTGDWGLVISTHGKDNRKPALIRQSIIFDSHTLTLLKEVRYEDSEAYFVRNKYFFERSKASKR